MKFNVFSERFIYNKPYAHLSLKYFNKNDRLPFNKRSFPFNFLPP